MSMTIHPANSVVLRCTQRAQFYRRPPPSNTPSVMAVSTRVRHADDSQLRRAEAKAVEVRNIVQSVMDARFGYETKSGGRMAPRTMKPKGTCIDGVPFMVIVPVSIHHLFRTVKIETIMDDSGNTTMAISQALRTVGVEHFQVRQLDNLDPSNPQSRGIYFVVLLQAVPELAAPQNDESLPKVAPLDWASRPKEGDLLVPLGVGGRGPVWPALRDIGHAMIVGGSGTGKTTWLHSALAGLLKYSTPEQLRIALIDPKRDLGIWSTAPHAGAFGDVAHEVADTTDLLRMVADEVRARCELFERARLVRSDIELYKRKTGLALPYVLVVFDECLDLVGESRALDDSLKMIARMGRSSGVLLWMATQHGTAVAGLPRVVNTNLLTRLVFRVVDGSAALAAGCPGAQLLPKSIKGRMLAKLDDLPVQVQAFYLEDDALEAVAGEVCCAGYSGDGTGQSAVSHGEGTAAHNGSELTARGMPVANFPLTENARRLVRWSVLHPAEFKGGMSRNLLARAFDRKDAQAEDGGKPIPERAIKETIELLAARKLLAGGGHGNPYRMLPALIELVSIEA